MAKVIHLAGGHSKINGLNFEPVDGEIGWVADNLSHDDLVAFDGVPGFEIVRDDDDQSAGAAAAKDANGGGKKAKAVVPKPDSLSAGSVDTPAGKPVF